mmetsp:Transcript_7825/g.20683  ORF Transcript_7825/g.20683 Transcript_7825/m.20683 type:complete len:209 (-) Transcript_7825:448-1074(-)
MGSCFALSIRSASSVVFCSPLSSLVNSASSAASRSSSEPKNDAGPTNDSTTGTSMKPCAIPSRMMRKKHLKNTRKMKLFAATRTKIARNVETPACRTGGPNDRSASVTRVFRDAPGASMNAFAMCTVKSTLKPTASERQITDTEEMSMPQKCTMPRMSTSEKPSDRSTISATSGCPMSTSATMKTITKLSPTARSISLRTTAYCSQKM